MHWMLLSLMLLTAKPTLPIEEQAFALKLNEQNQRIFMEQFNSELRKMALSLKLVSANDAVQKILKDQAIVKAESISQECMQ